MNNFENRNEDEQPIVVDTESSDNPHFEDAAGNAETNIETHDMSDNDIVIETQEVPDNGDIQAVQPNGDAPVVDTTAPSVSEEAVLTQEPVEGAQITTAGVGGVGGAGGTGIVQSIGHLLRNERQARNMTIDDVSRQLRLSVQQVDAIEREDYEKLPSRVFLRGFIRNYANLLKLDVEPIMQLLPDQSPVISPVERTPFKIKEISFSSGQDRNWNKLIIIGLALIFFTLIIYLVYPEDGWRNKSEEHINAPVELDTGQQTINLDLPLSSSTSSADQDLLASKDPMSALNTYGSLYFKFSEEALVQVIDSSGNSIFDQTNAGGTEKMLSGKRPLFVVIHNASGVELTYNDRYIDVKPYTNEQDGIARFTLE